MIFSQGPLEGGSGQPPRGARGGVVEDKSILEGLERLHSLGDLHFSRGGR